MKRNMVCRLRRLHRQVLPALMLGAALVAHGATTNVFESATNNPAGETILASGGDLLVFLGAVTNDGTLRATQGGVLSFFGPVVNHGTVEGVDGTVRFQRSFTNSGTLVGSNILSVVLVPQLYFQNNAGTVARWTLDRFGAFQYAQMIGNTREWKLKAAGDIDGDGIDDLVWQTAGGATAVWFIDENFGARSTRGLSNTGRWEVRACADSDGDGRAEIFFQEPGGTVAKWFLAADGSFQRAEVVGNTGPWRLQAAVPRMVGQGADLFWQRLGGDVYTWQWHTNAHWSVQRVGAAGNWNLCGSVDMDFDGTGDLVWQTPDGAVAAWEMQTNSAPRRVHAWNRTAGWKLRAAGHGRLAVSLNPAVSPATNDMVGLANNWLAAGTLSLSSGSGSTYIGGATMTVTGGGAGTMLQGGLLQILGSNTLGRLVVTPPTNGVTGVLTNVLQVGGGTLGQTNNFGTLTVLGGGVFTNGLTLGTNSLVITPGPITGGVLTGGVFTVAGGATFSNLVGSVYAGSDGTLDISCTNDVASGTLILGSNTNLFTGLTLIPPGEVYTNLTLQLLHGDLIGTMSNGVLRIHGH